MASECLFQCCLTHCLTGGGQKSSEIEGQRIPGTKWQRQQDDRHIDESGAGRRAGNHGGPSRRATRIVQGRLLTRDRGRPAGGGDHSAGTGCAFSPNPGHCRRSGLERHSAGDRRGIFLVDPLDGTKEFISGKDDFTVNIALIRNGVPVAGVVYAPCRGQAWTGKDNSAEKLAISGEGAILARHPIRARQRGASPWR